MNKRIKKTLYATLPFLLILLCLGMVSYIFAATSSSLQMDNIIAYEVPVGSGTKDDPFLIYRIGAADGTAEPGSFNYYAGKNATNTNYFASTNQYYFKQVYDLEGTSFVTVNLIGFYDGNYRTFDTTGAGKLFNYIGSSTYKTAKLSNLNVVNTNSGDTSGIATGLYGIIDCCTFSGKITSSADAGGFVATTYAGATISNSYNSANITSTTSHYAGGFVGVSTGATTLTNCYNTGKISGSGTTTGGLIGNALANTATITNCYNYGTISGTTKGALVGNGSGLTISNSYWNSSCGASYACPSSTSTAAGSNRTIAQMQYQGSYTNWSFGNFGTATSGWCFVAADVTVDGTVQKLILPRLWFEKLTTHSTYTISFNKGTGSGTMGSQLVIKGQAVTLVPVAFTAPTDQVFSGWALTTGGAISYTDEATFTPASSITLYAIWEYPTFIVTLNKQSGTGGTGSVTARFNSAMPTATAPTRTGYTFGGYYTETNGGGTQYYTAAMASARNWDKKSTATLYAKWTPITYKVRYYLNYTGASPEYFTVSCTYDTSYAYRTAANFGYTRTGYTLSSFKSAASSGTTYSLGATYKNLSSTAGTTVSRYAQWTANTYTVTLNQQSGSGGTTSVTATYDSAMPEATAPTRTGYTFGGYYTEENGGGTQYYTAAMASAKNWDKTSATTLYAKWTANTYTVTLDRQSGSNGSTSVTATYGSAMPTATAPTRTGYTFGGYYTSTGGSGTQYYTAAMASAKNWDKTSATTLYAKWTANTYTVTLDRQSGSNGSTSVTATYGSAMPTATAPTRTGYTFGGYYTSTGGSGTQYYTAAMASAKNWDKTSATTLYAKWTANTYTVTLDRQSGSNGSTSVTATYGSAMPTATAPTRTGYTFGGYYTSTGGSGTQYYTAAMASAKNWDKTSATTLYAKWTANTYTVTLDRQSGSNGSASVTATYNSAMPTATAPSRTGYTFGGYYTGTGGSGTQYYTAAMASAKNWDKTSATTLYAKWTANTYTVTLDRQSGSGGSASVTATYNSAMPTATAPTRTGYTFGGYYTSTGGSGTQYYTAAMASAKNWDKTSATTLYAKWTANTYTVTLDRQSGSGGSASVTATYNSAMPTATAPTRTGYTFGGYYTSTGGSGTQYYTATMASARNWDKTSNTTLYAKWTIKSYTITFNSNNGYLGGYVVSSVSGASYGFSQSGSYYVSGNKGVHNSAAVCRLDFYATAGSTLTLGVINSGESNYDYGIFSHLNSTLSTSSSADSTYYKRYYGESSTSEVSLTYSISTTGSYYIYIKFRKDSSQHSGNDTLQFRVISGVEAYSTSTTTTKTLNHGSTINPLPVAVRAGYSFNGWYTATSGGTKVTTSTTFTATQTLYAQWTSSGGSGGSGSSSYTITFNANGGTIGGYTVSDVSGADYGFSLNSSGYWESTNKGVQSSAAVCRVDFSATAGTNVIFTLINYAESSFDFGIFSNLNSTLSLDNTEDSSNVHQSFKGNQSSGTQTTSYSISTTGNYFVYVKYRKDGSVDSNNDSLQFYISSGVSTSSSTQSKTYTAGSTLGELPLASRSGYTFDGWYTASSGGSKISSSTTVTATKTYYAHWTSSGSGSTTYSVYASKHNSSPSSGCSYSVSPSTVSSSGTYVTFTASVSSGYTFQGWYTSSSSTSSSYRLTTSTSYSTTLSSSTTYYAYWTQNTSSSTYTVYAAAHYSAPSSGCSYSVSPSTVSSSGTYVTFTASVSSGYTFTGWYTSPHSIALSYRLTTNTSYSVTLYDTTTYYAYWTQNATSSYQCECAGCGNYITSGTYCTTCTDEYPYCPNCNDCSYHYTMCDDCGRCEGSCCICVDESPCNCCETMTSNSNGLCNRCSGSICSYCDKCDNCEWICPKCGYCDGRCTVVQTDYCECCGTSLYCLGQEGIDNFGQEYLDSPTYCGTCGENILSYNMGCDTCGKCAWHCTCCKCCGDPASGNICNNCEALGYSDSEYCHSCGICYGHAFQSGNACYSCHQCSSCCPNSDDYYCGWWGCISYVGCSGTTCSGCGLCIEHNSDHSSCGSARLTPPSSNQSVQTLKDIILEQNKKEKSGLINEQERE